MADAARATSAAPTYFSPAELDQDRHHYRALVDGGVFVNNPAMCA
jgi:patatin-like phospholipase/acyl hydrolase